MSQASEPKPEKKQQSRRWQPSSELQTINRIQKELAHLDLPARNRVISYVVSSLSSIEMTNELKEESSKQSDIEDFPS